MSMKALDIFWYLGIAICLVYIGIYAAEAVKLSSQKKKYVLVKGKAGTCTMEKKWAYTAMNVKYEYAVEGKMVKSTASVRSVLKPGINQGADIEIYYDKKSPGTSFLAEQIRADGMNIVVLLVMLAILVITLVFGM